MSERRAALLALLLAACSSPAATRVRLELAYDDSWGLTEVDVRVNDKGGRVPIAHVVEVLVPDGWADLSLPFDIWALRGEDRVAYGHFEATPVRAAEVVAHATLSLLPCGAWCTAGATTCDGDATVTCEQRDGDFCMEWSEPTPCPTDAPACSNGACASACIDECAEGERRCDGPGGTRACGQADGDSCRDWGPFVACAPSERCSNGACAGPCQDECTPGDRRCLGSATMTCGDANLDECAEWGPPVPCGAGESCSGGACSAVCQDECQTSTCSGLDFNECGQFDGDDCTDLSPGTSCASADPCLVGSCTATGCQSEPFICDRPPAPECISPDTLRVYAGTGTCSSLGCDYAHQDMACPGCPSCTPPADGTCASPFPVAGAGGSSIGATSGGGRLAGSCGGDTSPELVYSWTPAASGTATISTCGSSLDSALYVENGGCGAELACDTASCPDGRGGQVTVAVNAGQTYSIIVYGNQDVGDYTLSVVLPRGLTATGAPSERSGHSAVWTGTQMLVWGGAPCGGCSEWALADGAAYDPAQDRWTALGTANAPTQRVGHSAVWTGTEMIVFGGVDCTGCSENALGDGARYDPGSKTWTPLETDGAPSPRVGHSAVWTGSEMVVWGGLPCAGCSVDALLDGGRYNPATRKWSPLVGGLVARSGHSAVWTGNEMLVWGGVPCGGCSENALADVESFHPGTGNWDYLGAPTLARTGHSAVWTGRDMIVWGGADCTGCSENAYSDGARRSPSGDWSMLPTLDEPAARTEHSAVWTGSEMVVWGGLPCTFCSVNALGDGARWVP